MKETKYAGTQTEKNLMAAFAGESEARNKYTYFASKAKKEGYEQIESVSGFWCPMMLMRRIGFVAMCSFPLLSCFWETASFPTECTKSLSITIQHFIL